MQNNLINLQDFQNHKQRKKMIALILISSLLLGILIWNYFIENPPIPNIKIPESQNITYNVDDFSTITPSDIINEIEHNKGKPILLYLYTTWCSICQSYLPTINEMARKFQNSDVLIFTVAIDRNINHQLLATHLNSYGKIYFKPNYLLYQDGLGDLLKNKGIKFDKVIPLTILIDRNGNVVKQFTGPKSENFLNRKIIKMISQNGN